MLFSLSKRFRLTARSLLARLSVVSALCFWLLFPLARLYSIEIDLLSPLLDSEWVNEREVNAALHLIEEFAERILRQIDL